MKIWSHWPDLGKILKTSLTLNFKCSVCLFILLLLSHLCILQHTRTHCWLERNTSVLSHFCPLGPAYCIITSFLLSVTARRGRHREKTVSPSDQLCVRTWPIPIFSISQTVKVYILQKIATGLSEVRMYSLNIVCQFSAYHVFHFPLSVCEC